MAQAAVAERRTARWRSLVAGGRRLIGMLLLTATASPSAPALDPRVPAYAYDVKNWFSDDGLPHNTIHGLGQSADGYLWIATWNGLARFNGREFHVYDRQNTPALSDDAIRAVLLSRDGSLWLATARGGLIRGRGEKWQHWTTRHGLPTDALLSLAEGRDGSIWIGTQGRGALRWRAGTITVVELSPAADRDWIQRFWVEDDGGVWIAGGRTLTHWREAGVRSYGIEQGLPAKAVYYALTRDRQGTLWLGTDHGLFRLDGERFVAFGSADGRPSPAVSTLLLDRQGSLWIGTLSEGLLRRVDDRLERLDARRGLSNNRITALLEDVEGNLWVGSNAGLNRLSDSPFVSFSRRDGLSDDFVRSVWPSRDGGVWVGSSGGVDHLSGGRVTTPSWVAQLSSRSVMSVFEDRRGTVWVGTYDGGLNRWDGQRMTVYDRPQGLPNSQVRAIFEAADGTLWVGTAQGAVAIVDGRVRRSLTRSDGLPADYVLSFAEHPPGRLWIGTVDGFATLEAGRVASIGASQGFPANDVFAFHFADDGVVWLASNRGLIRYVAGRFLAFGRAQGLPDETLFSIFADASGAFWLGTNSGLVQVARRDLEAVGAGAADRLRPRVFKRADGMTGTQINGGSQPSAAPAAGGSLWLPTARGVTWFDPMRLSASEPRPIPTVIESFAVDGQPLATPVARPIPPGHRHYAFRFVGLSYSRPDLVRYRHRLSGFDTDWSVPHSEGQVTYTNLPPGRYRFEVIAGTEAGNWSAPARLDFRVEPRLEQRPLFWVALVGVGLLAAFGWHRLRLTALRRRESELERAVSERTEEIREQNRRLAEIDRERNALLTTIQVQAEAYARQAREDALTGLPNRRHFDEQFALAFAEARRLGRPITVAVLDADHFKRINDRFGHRAGDLALCALADRLQQNLGAYGMVARLGGEEFAAYFAGLGVEAARVAGEQTLEAIRAIRLDEFPDLRLSVSIGLSDDRDAVSHERLLQLADAKLYQAKLAGRDRIVV